MQCRTASDQGELYSRPLIGNKRRCLTTPAPHTDIDTQAHTHTHLTKTKSLEMRAANEALGFTGHEKFIIPDLYMKL